VTAEGDSTPTPQAATLVVRPVETPALNMRLYDRGGWSVIEITGELDIQGVPLLRQLLVRAGHHLVFDLTRVTFVDCGGLRIIVGSVSPGASATRRVVSQENGKVRRLFRLTGWDRSVLLYDTVDEAVREPV
jgi:anti-sigma B factor antagonist